MPRWERDNWPRNLSFFRNVLIELLSQADGPVKCYAFMAGKKKTFRVPEELLKVENLF